MQAFSISFLLCYLQQRFKVLQYTHSIEGRLHACSGPFNFLGEMRCTEKAVKVLLLAVAR
jgi:hypothetical protein